MLQQRMMSISLCIAAIMGGLSLTGCSKSSDKTAATETQATSAPASKSSDTIKVGILHSLSGTMAISETSLKDTALMTINEINAKGGVLGKKLEPVVVDPASDWPLFAEKARQLITQDKVAVILDAGHRFRANLFYLWWRNSTVYCFILFNMKVRNSLKIYSTRALHRTSKRFLRWSI